MPAGRAREAMDESEASSGAPFFMEPLRHRLEPCLSWLLTGSSKNGATGCCAPARETVLQQVDTEQNSLTGRSLVNLPRSR